MVDRYNMIGRDTGARMDVSPNGVWVRYRDLAAARAEIERLTKDRDLSKKLLRSCIRGNIMLMEKAQKAMTERDEARSMLADAERDMRQRAADFVGQEARTFPDNVAWGVEDVAKAILALPLKHADRDEGK